MRRHVGIDIRSSHVRAALILTGYRKLVVERLVEIDMATAGTVEQALASTSLPLVQQAESYAVSVEGDSSFIHHITLPATAMKQVAAVLPFELEAQVPVDLDELVYDWRLIGRPISGQPIGVLTAASRIEHVRERIELTRRVLGREPERIGCGPLPLANLVPMVPELTMASGVALIDLGGTRTEVVLLSNGEAVFARTLSRGVEGLPDSAPALAAELRQTFAGWHGRGHTVELAFLLGGGAAAPGAAEYLASVVGVRVEQLPRLAIEGIGPDDLEVARRFAKAISLALGLAVRPRDLDLRRGPLSYQRGFGFFKDKAPLLSGLGAAILVSFAFSTWAELRGLSREEEVLTSALGHVSKDVLGQETTDAAQAMELLEKAKALDESDPMPHMDGFDVMVELSKAIPTSVTHDIEELDMQRGHVKMNGLVGSAQDAQLISGALGGNRCFKDVKIGKITQAVNTDRQKYTLEFDVRCPEDAAKKKPEKKTKEGGKEGGEQ